MAQISNITNHLYTFILVFALTACSGSGGDPGAPRNPKADLASLKVSASGSALANNFRPEILDYTITVNSDTNSIRVTPEVSTDAISIVEISTLNHTETVNSLSSSSSIPLEIGSNPILIKVTAANGSTAQTYSIDVQRLETSGFNQTLRLAADFPVNNEIFGNQISLSGNTIAVGAPSSEDTETGSVYIYDRDSNGFWSPPVKLVASNAGLGDRYGASVALSGNTLVVGSPLEDSRATGANNGQSAENAKLDEDIDGFGDIGAVYVYTRVPGTSTWNEQAYLKPFGTRPNSNRYLQFGSKVTIDGDTIAVGAELEKSNATGINGDEDDRSYNSAGAVFVFTRNGNQWSKDAYIKASNTDKNDKFGSNLALSGNILAVGAKQEGSSATGINGNQSSNSATRAGAVYVFNRSGNLWEQQAYIKASNTDSYDQFGISIDIDGETLVVGAMFENSYASGVATNIPNTQDDNSVSSSGAVYVFTRDGETWSQQAYLKSANPEIRGNFGKSVAISGDTLAVGAIGEQANSGTVHYFTRAGNDWSQQEPVKASNIGPYRFGSSIDLDIDTLAASAPDENDNKGIVYILK